jgi:hypothetical protein
VQVDAGDGADRVGHRGDDSGRRPSLTFGMHSISMNGSILAARLYFRDQRCYNRGRVRTYVRSARTDGTRAHDASRRIGSRREDRAAPARRPRPLLRRRYELAINVWTRALFLDRSHARARAYIERARSALAERQRESEELLQNGVAAFQRGDGDEARRLLQAAIEAGRPSEEALAGARATQSRRALPLPARAAAASSPDAPDERPSSRSPPDRLGSRAIVAAAVAVLECRVALRATGVEGRSLVELASAPRRARPRAARPPVVGSAAGLPRARARRPLPRQGACRQWHLREALTRSSRSAPPIRRRPTPIGCADIQRNCCLDSVPTPPSPDREKSDRQIP